MKKITFLLFSLLCSSLSFGQQALITGYVDSPCSNANGRTVEIYVEGTIDFTGWNLVRQSNGGGFTSNMDLSSLGSITDAFAYVTNNSATLQSEFGITTNVIQNGNVSSNGDDAFQIINDSAAVVDRFGEDGVDGSGTAWEHVDTYCYRKDGATANAGAFNASNWTFGSQNLLDNEGTCIGGNALSTLVPFGSYSTVPSANPALTITSPSTNQAYNNSTTSVDIAFTTENFDLTGGNFVEYIVNGGSAQSTTTSPISVSVTEGQSYSVTLELKDAGGSLSPQVIETATFTIATGVTDIAALRGQATRRAIGDYYTITGEAILTFQQSFRNQKFIEDASGAILIDDSSGIITSSYNVGDGITGITGQLGDFNGQLQLIPTEDSGAASSTGNTVQPQIISVADLTANPENYESELVGLVDVSVDNTNSTTWDTGVEYVLTQGTDNFTFRASFFDADYIGATVPVTQVNVVGVITERDNGSYFITARDSNDFPANLSTADFNERTNTFNIHPNPVYDGMIYFPVFENRNMEVKVYSILGEEVARKSLKDNYALNVSNLAPGVYLVQLLENNKRITTKKLIVK